MKKVLFGLAMVLLSIQTFSQHNSSVSSNSNVSISVSSDDDDYTYFAKFDTGKTAAAKSLIVKSLGNPTTESGKSSIWEGKGYEISIKEGKVEMELDKEAVTKSFQSKIEELGEQISETVGSKRSARTPKTPRTSRK